MDIDKIQELKAEWDALQPLSPDNDRRLWQKLRLEWNYHSNHLEGNTLTYGETELLLIHGQTHGNHTIREYEEMKAHDVGIAHLRELAADKTRLLGEGDIRDLNKIILKEPYWKPTRTPDGQVSRAQVIPGSYKSLPNSVITATGELFEYAAPIDVPARMQSLTNWLSEALSQRSIHILDIAARLHHDFVLIHPFDDGNGRVARMLVNYVLLRDEYPPIIVPTERKTDYLTCLRLADAGDRGALAEFFGELLLRSLDLAIRAGKGKNIDEPSDVEKQVALFVRQQKARASASQPSKDTVRQLMEISLLPFIHVLQQRLMSLAPLFARVDSFAMDGNGNAGSLFGVVSDYHVKDTGPGQKFQINFTFSSYQGAADSPFDYQTVIGVHFPPEHYSITHDSNTVLTKPYSEPVLAEEADALSAKILAKCFGVIRGKASPRE